MKKEYLFSGKTVSDALSKGCEALGVSDIDITYEVVRTKTKGFLGIGGNDAEIKIVYDDGLPEPVAEETVEPKKEKKEKKEKKAKEEKAPEQSEDPRLSDLSAFATGLLERMGVKNPTCSLSYEEERLRVNLDGEGIGSAIGKHGETLDSVQYILSLYINKYDGDFIRLSADMSGYRKKRENALCALANRIADNVLKKRNRFTLEPMPANERRIIHSALQGRANIVTRSVGEEPRRKVVVEYSED